MSSLPEFFNFASDVFDRWSEARPQADALWWVSHDGGDERRFTFADLSELSLRAACAFARSGIGEGDLVMVLLPRVPEWWIAMLGLIRCGAVPVTCTPQLTAADLAYRLDAGPIGAVVTDAEGASKIPELTGVRWLCRGEAPGWRSMAAALEEAAQDYSSPRTRADAPGLVFFTSSTTGNPKMVLHTQASYGLGHEVTGKLWLDLGPGDLHWNTSDLGWAKAAWSSFFGPWHAGACVFAWDSGPKFSATATLQMLRRYPITTLCAPPTAYRMMVRRPLDQMSFPRLRHCVTAGEPLQPEVLARWRDLTGLTIHEGYGQTESVILIGQFKSDGIPVLPGSIGRATPGYDIHLLDDELSPVADGKEGEIAIRLSTARPVGLFREYWRSPEETARHFRDGWYLTGDRAIRDGHGCFRFLGRKDDIIKSSGYRIGPFEVESALLSHPAVHDAAVVGRPDPLRGQIVKAFVVLNPGHPPDEATRHVLQAHCKKCAAAYKSPREIEFVDSLPKTTSGKTRRFQLRETPSQS